MSFKRVLLIIIDGCGVGALPDASTYNDKGASTLSNCADAVNGLLMPTCQTLGLGNIVPISGLPPVDNPIACYGKMAELSAGKDSTIGHWEIAGIITEQPFPTYPNGFPHELISKIERAAKVKFIGNCTASGTEIIERLGEQHLRTKKLILYTSADSVFQIAAHEDVYSISELYKICETARSILTNEHAVARVIARPFIGEVGKFKRTRNRKDFSLEPPSKTILNLLKENQYKTLAIGKIQDLFCGDGITTHINTKSNLDGMTAIKDAVTNDKTHQFIFANLIDFDELCGHRRDPQLFSETLEQFDNELYKLLPALHDEDLLIITADHGNDPTYTKHTDHTREFVPLLVYNKKMKTGLNLGTRNSFSDIAKTIAEIFNIENKTDGTSFLKEIIQ